jgi:tetratricopeptide (TPR) repeat protein
MKNLLIKTGPFLLIVGACLVTSCGHRRTPVLEPNLEEARIHVVRGEYERAIDSYQAIIKTVPGEKAVLAEYAKVLEGMADQAERARAAGDYATAERIYALLLNSYPRFREIQLPLTFSPSWLNVKILQGRFGQAEDEARRDFESGNYQKALKAYENFTLADFGMADHADRFNKITLDIKHQADSSAEAGDYVRAGKAYAALLESYPRLEEIGLRPDFLRSQLEEGLDNCRTRLTQKGLEEYRKGNLDRAIAHWQELLEFDPDNIEIKKAVETASDLQKKLRKK